MNRRWRLGIVGCGWAGEQHARALAQLADRAELGAIADLDIETARARAGDWQVPVWTCDYRDLLDNERLDALSICLPQHLHAPAAIAAAHAGLHVLVEKPLATTLDEEVPQDNPFVAEIAHFLDCLETDQEPITSGGEQRAPLLAVLATYASIQDGKRVYLSEFDRLHSAKQGSPGGPASTASRPAKQEPSARTLRE